MPNIRPSFTSYDKFTNHCERACFFKWIRKLPEAPSHYLTIGNCLHGVLAAVLRHPEPVIVELDKFVTAVVAQTKSEMKDGWLLDVPEDQLIQELVAQAQRVSRQIFPHLKVRAVEAWSNKVNPGARYCAKLDVLSDCTPTANEDGEIVGALPVPCVLDWKTVFSEKRKRTQESTDLSAQLALYCLEAGVSHGVFVEIPRDLARPLRTIHAEFDAYTLARWARHFEVQFAALATRGTDEAAYKLASPGFPLCSPRWCSYWRDCPGGEHK